MKYSKWLLSLLLLAVLAACATMSSVPDGEQVGEQQGLLVFHVTTPHGMSQLQFTEFSDKTSFGYYLADEFGGPEGAFQLQPGSAYWVKPVKAGEYMWSRLVVGNRYAVFHGSNRFTIKPGTITYVGHLTVRDRGDEVRIGVRDDEAAMRAFLAENYPQYSATMPFEKSVTEFGF